jgi:hypothetical protein
MHHIPHLTSAYSQQLTASTCHSIKLHAHHLLHQTTTSLMQILLGNELTAVFLRGKSHKYLLLVKYCTAHNYQAACTLYTRDTTTSHENLDYTFKRYTFKRYTSDSYKSDSYLTISIICTGGVRIIRRASSWRSLIKPNRQ